MKPITAMWIKLFFVIFCAIVHSSAMMPGLSFAVEPESDLNERGNVSFTCEPQSDFQGLVTVEWFRNNVRLEPHSANVLKMESDGKQHILEMRESQKAKYYCTISLAGTPLKLISQTALSIPMNIEEYPGPSSARHIQVREGSIAVIPCGPLPRSEPKARPILKFRRKELVLDKRFKQMPSGDIFIYNAKKEDAGDYVCIAENPMTGRRKEAPFMVYLIVSPKESDGELRTNATLVHGPPPRIEAVVGSNVTMECIGNGFPMPKISWQRLGSYLPAGYSEGDGTLTLRSVTSKHSGLYECAISNFVSVRTRTELVVLEPPRLKEPEKQGYEVHENTPVTLECEVTRGEPKPNITWYFNGRLLASDETKNIYVSQNEVHITKANNDLHMGHYQCFADNSLGTTYKQFLVRILSYVEKEFTSTIRHSPKEKEIDMPKKDRAKASFPVPSRPHAKQDDLNEVTIQWTISNSSLSVKFFKVQYIAEGQDWQTAEPDISPTTRSFRVKGLVYKKYRFRVIAVYENNSHGLGKSSKWFILSRSKKANSHTKPDDIPKEVPVVTIVPTSPSTLTVHWKIVGAVPEGFLLKYRRTDSAGEWLTQRLSNARPWIYTISHLAPAQHYEVKIAAASHRNEGNFSSIEVGRTQDSHPFSHDIDFDIGSETNSLEPHHAAFEKQHLVYVVVSSTLGLSCLAFVGCVIHSCWRLARERRKKPDERVRRQLEAAAYVNDANSNFTPAISTVDLEDAVAGGADDVNENASDSEESNGPQCLQSTSHEKVPRSEKEYALKILTQLYTTNGHIVNINSNFNAMATCVQSV